MIRKFKPHCWAFLLPLLLSCSHVYYSPNSLNVPHLTGKNDGNISAGISIGGRQDGYEIKSTFSPAKYLAVMGNFSSGSQDNLNNISSSWSRNRLGEVAGGVYYPTEYWSFSLFSGYGWGKSSHLYAEGSSADLQVRRFFIQPGASFHAYFFNFSIGARISHLDFPHGKIDFRSGTDPNDDEELSALKLIDQDAPFTFIEPGASMGVSTPIGPLTSFLTITGMGNNEKYHFRNYAMGLQFGINFHDIYTLRHPEKKPKNFLTE